MSAGGTPAIRQQHHHLPAIVSQPVLLCLPTKHQHQHQYSNYSESIWAAHKVLKPSDQYWNYPNSVNPDKIGLSMPEVSYEDNFWWAMYRIVLLVKSLQKKFCRIRRKSYANAIGRVLVKMQDLISWQFYVIFLERDYTGHRFSNIPQFSLNSSRLLLRTNWLAGTSGLRPVLSDYYEMSDDVAAVSEDVRLRDRLCRAQPLLLHLGRPDLGRPQPAAWRGGGRHGRVLQRSCLSRPGGFPTKSCLCLWCSGSDVSLVSWVRRKIKSYPSLYASLNNLMRLTPFPALVGNDS